MVNVEKNQKTIEEFGEVCVEFRRTNGMYFQEAVGNVTLPDGREVSVGVSMSDRSLMLLLPPNEG